MRQGSPREVASGDEGRESRAHIVGSGSEWQQHKLTDSSRWRHSIAHVVLSKSI